MSTDKENLFSSDYNFTVHNRPSVASMTADGACSGSGVLVVEPNGISAPPLAISFGKVPPF